MGWFTVLLYAVAALGGARLARSAHLGMKMPELWFWRVLALALLALGINKQLDLQSALTELGRILAREQGWHERRRDVQVFFIAAVGITSLLTASLLTFLLRATPWATKLSLIGMSCLLSFVVVRASSFHHVDHFIGSRVVGLRWNWILEIGGIVTIIAGTQLRRFAARKPGSGAPDREGQEAAGGRSVRGVRRGFRGSTGRS